MNKIFSSAEGKKVLFCFAFLLSTMLLGRHLEAQKVTDFTGTWLLDIPKSDPAYARYKAVACTIKQTAEMFTVQEVFTEKSGSDIAMNANSFTLDGKETAKEEQGGTDRQSISWSKNKTVLIAKMTRTVGQDVYGSYVSYSLSENGRILTVITTGLDTTKNFSIKEVFVKKP